MSANGSNGNGKGPRFGKVPESVLAEFGKQLGAAAIAVLVVLDLRADKEGVCWPSIDGISDLTGLSRSSVKRALKTLAREDKPPHAISRPLITIEHRLKATSRYRIIPARGSQGTPQVVQPEPVGVHREPLGGQAEPLRGSQGTGEGFPVNPEPCHITLSYNLVTEPGGHTPLSLATEFCARCTRTWNGKPDYTPKGIESRFGELIRQLERQGRSADEIHVAMTVDARDRDEKLDDFIGRFKSTKTSRHADPKHADRHSYRKPEVANA